MVSKDILDSYIEHDKYFCVNENDEDLTPIYLSLPEPPPLHLIDGYGLEPREQFFRRHELPSKLVNLEKRVLRTLEEQAGSNHRKTVTGAKIVNEFWRILEEEKDYYSDEIDYIEKVIWHTIHGYWFFNKGKPTYITPFHYELLNFWYNPDLDHIGYYFEYRDRDRRKMLLDYYAYTTHETFKDIDDKGFAIKNADGLYDMIEKMSRTFYGTIKAKNRRSGETHQGLLYNWAIIRKKIGGVATIVSKSGGDAKRYWDEKFLPAWRKYPIFLKPMWGGSNDPNSLYLNPPANDYSSKGLDSKYFVTESADELANDGGKLFSAIFDEQAKVPTKGAKVDVYKRHNINKITMSQGEDIHGFCTNPSTVEEMNAGGEIYITMISDSYFYQRMPNGQTATGLVSCYMPSQDGWEGYIDPYGYSIIDNPTKQQIEDTKWFYNKYRINKSRYKYLDGLGAYNALSGKLEALKKDGSPNAMKQYRELVRKFPMKFADCLIGGSGDIGYPIEMMDSKMNTLRDKKDSYKGYFRWKYGQVDGDVEFVSDPDGWFDMFEDVLPQYKNKRKKTRLFNPAIQDYEMMVSPLYPHLYTCGVDSYEFDDNNVISTGTSQSDGGVTMLYHGSEHFSNQLDNQWIYFKDVLSARFRIAPYDFNEQVLMACIYFGSLMYPERNKVSTWEHFVKRGYRGYLKYDVDANNKIADKPGYYVGDKTELIVMSIDFFEHMTDNVNSFYLLEEAKNMKSVKDLTKNDRLASFLAALKGSQSPYGKIMDVNSYEKVDIGFLLNTKRRF